jgi:hypothetical protein
MDVQYGQMTAKISITSTFHTAEDLKAHLRSEALYDCILEIERRPQRFRNVEGSVLVALVGLAGTGLGTLITGLLNVAAQRQGASIEIKGADWSVKVPAGIEPDELNRLIEIAKAKKEISQIVVRG